MVVLYLLLSLMKKMNAIVIMKYAIRFQEMDYKSEILGITVTKELIEFPNSLSKFAAGLTYI